jgi:LysR family transcriptional regulator, nitrogen assimilation regulatory protein
VDEHQLRCFLAIAESGSVSGAAARIDVSQPSLSQILLRIEDELRIKLFVRTSRGVSLTEAGRVFQEHARNILREMQRAREEVHGHDGVAQTSVAVGLPGSISALLAARLVVAVRERLGGISVRLDEAASGHIQEWLEHGAIELGVLHHVDALRHLSVRRLAVEELLLVGPPGRFGPPDRHGVAEGEIAVPAAEARPLLLPTWRHGLRQFVEREAMAQGVELTVDVELDALAHIKALVSMGYGYSLLSHSAVQEDLAAGRLSAVRMSRPALRRSIYLVRNPTRVVTRASVRVEDLMTSMLKAMVADGTWLAEWVGPDPAAGEP